MSAACGRRRRALGEHLVEARDAVADDVLRDSLQVQIQRRVDVRCRRRRAIFLLEHLADVVDEVRRLGIERACRDLQWFLASRDLPRQPLTNPASAIARRTTLRRSRARSR